MDHYDNTPWYVVARRLVPFILLNVLLRVCWGLIYLGYGKVVAQEFYRDVLK